MITTPEMKRMTGEVKAVSLDDAGPGYLEGYANVLGVIDSYSERTMPGAFAQDIQEFIGKGYLLLDHEWEVETAIGYILEAREDSMGLWFKAEFHSTPQAQEIRRKLAERIAAGKEVGLSIGYWVIEAESITEEGETIRELKRLLVKEVSVVVAQGNAPSTVTAAKSTRSDEFITLFDAVNQYGARLIEIDSLGTRSDNWKQSRRDELVILIQQLSKAVAVLAPEEPEPQVLEATDDDDGDYLAALALIELDLIAN